jgi:hypothetical protein
MNREQIIRMAREAVRLPEPQTPQEEAIERALAPIFERFAALVAAAEREACAKVCDAVQKKNEDDGAWMWEARNCAAAIRARGEQCG